MSNGFDNPKAKVVVNKEELNKIVRQYKKAKKYMRSSIFTVKTMDGTEEYISGLIDESDDPSLMN